ncbi:hypothetical protein V7075_20390 [Neobacillus drentensis]|uniref:hypothetical protein n=1 Tax=Neobacillus drentensis TaxID=220684 RepID=UPI002FFFE02C
MIILRAYPAYTYFFLFVIYDVYRNDFAALYVFQIPVKVEKLFSLVGMEDLFHLTEAEIYEVLAVSEQ